MPNWHRSRFGARFGGTLLPNLLGGKTYFFANYEGYRWPNSETVEKIAPSASMRLGLLTFDGGATYYNLNPGPVTFNNVTYPGSGTSLDPRGLGINPLVQQLWNHMPLPNEVNGDCGLSRCDMAAGVGNIGGFKANLALPQTSNFGVLRLDHDFGDKWLLDERPVILHHATCDHDMHAVVTCSECSEPIDVRNVRASRRSG